MRRLFSFLCRCAVHHPPRVSHFAEQAPCRRCGTPLVRDRWGRWHPPDHFHPEIARSLVR